MPHPLMFGFKQSVKVFSVKLSLPTDPRKFSPSKVYHYTVLLRANIMHKSIGTPVEYMDGRI